MQENDDVRIKRAVASTEWRGWDHKRHKGINLGRGGNILFLNLIGGDTGFHFILL